MNNWISVKKMLPSNKQKVLCTDGEGMDVRQYEDNPGKLFFLNSDNKGKFSKVTHWQPLPEPPEGE